MIEPYTYNANVTKVYDGDTITVDIDLGLGVWIRGEKIRLFGINAPEVRGEERIDGLASRDWLRKLILERTVVIKTIKDSKGKYGRYLGRVFIEGQDVAQLIIAAGHAVEANY